MALAVDTADEKKETGGRAMRPSIYANSGDICEKATAKSCMAALQAAVAESICCLLAPRSPRPTHLLFLISSFLLSQYI